MLRFGKEVSIRANVAEAGTVHRIVCARTEALITMEVDGVEVLGYNDSEPLTGPEHEMLGLYFGDQDQHFDHNTSQDHVAPDTGSDLLYKGALDDRAQAAFRGIIRVHPDAQRTDAYQTNRNLLLSDECRANSLPNLEIQADNVKCSHGATVGQLESEVLFYLLSRGLSREQPASHLEFFAVEEEEEPIWSIILRPLEHNPVC